MSVPTVDLRADLIKIWKEGGFAELQLLNSTAGNAGWVLADTGDGTLEFIEPPASDLDGVLAAGGSLSADRSSDLNSHSWTFTNGEIIFAASTTGHPSFNIPIGVAPSSPVTGDIWHTSGHLFFRDGSTTYDLLAPTPTLDSVLSNGGSFSADRTANFNAHKWTISGGQTIFAATTTTYPSINLPAGTAVTSPASGDLYHTTGHLFFRDGSTTYDLLAAITSIPSWDATLAIGLNTSRTPTQTQTTKGGGQHWWQWILKPDTSDPIQPYGTFNSALDDTFVDGSGNRDHVFNFVSYNYPGTGITVNSSEAAWRFGVERFFTNGLGNLMEFHMPNITTTAATDVRLYSIYANRDNGSSLHQWYGNTFSWYKVGFSSQSYSDLVIDGAGSVTLNLNATQGTGGASGTGLNQIHINLAGGNGFPQGIVTHDYYMVVGSYYLQITASQLQFPNYIVFHVADYAPTTTYSVQFLLPTGGAAHGGDYQFLDDAGGNIVSLGTAGFRAYKGTTLDGRTSFATGSFASSGAIVQITASTTSYAHMNLAPGVAPSSPNNGDVYNDGTHAYIRIAGAWKQLDN